MWLARTTLLAPWPCKTEKQNQSCPAPHLRGTPHLSPATNPQKQGVHMEIQHDTLQLVFLLDHTLNTQDTRLPCPNGPMLSSGTWMGFFLGLAIKGKTVTGVCKPKTWGWPKPTVFVLFYVKKDRVNHKTPVVKDGTVGGNKRRAGHHDTKESNNSNLAFQGITKLYLSRKHQRIYYVTVC